MRQKERTSKAKKVRKELHSQFEVWLHMWELDRHYKWKKDISLQSSCMWDNKTTGYRQAHLPQCLHSHCGIQTRPDGSGSESNNAPILRRQASSSLTIHWREVGLGSHFQAHRYPRLSIRVASLSQTMLWVSSTDSFGQLCIFRHDRVVHHARIGPIVGSETDDHRSSTFWPGVVRFVRVLTEYACRPKFPSPSSFPCPVDLPNQNPQNPPSRHLYQQLDVGRGWKYFGNRNGWRHEQTTNHPQRQR